MLISKKPDVLPSEITPYEVFEKRREFLKAAGFGLAATAAVSTGLLSLPARAADVKHGPKIGPFAKTAYGADEKLTSFEDVASYNNYYEFGTSKSDPHQNAGTLKTRPWTVSIEGDVKKPKTISIEQILKLAPLEERIYRMRCVEGWSMVIPWVGFPLSKLVQWAEPTGNAKYVEFVTLADPMQMPGVRVPILDWPYVEGLRMDEAMHPLTIMAVGLYGEVLPNQNGAPMRLVVPWKYGFKGAKSIVRIRFTEKIPQTAWMKTGPEEYGFYANVNPNVHHPRWSQATERRIGGGLFSPRIRTQMFNGYADQVAQLYSGMDLRRNF
jgi:methionine sulfoxide reductase catalytic subunit